MAAEPSQFLNEMPLELIEDLSYGSSWLSFARGGAARSNKHAVEALRGETRVEKPKNLYTGKTYNSKDAVAEFFKSRAAGGASDSSPSTGGQAAPRGFDKLRSQASDPGRSPERVETGKFVAGSHVRHAKYGNGLVLRREGSGDNAKLTISFPGFGQKKLIEKYANLEKA
jgi:DNA helicase-2/ATP-dependent DNA helicase PcrA